MSELIGIHPASLDVVWNEVEPLLERACAVGPPRIGPDDIYDAISDSRMQLWVSINGKIEAACITELVNHPLARVCRVFLCAGEDRENWQHFIRRIEGWALENGCKSMEVPGRKGWKKVLSDYGETYVLLEKSLVKMH